MEYTKENMMASEELISAIREYKENSHGGMPMSVSTLKKNYPYLAEILEETGYSGRMFVHIQPFIDFIELMTANDKKKITMLETLIKRGDIDKLKPYISRQKFDTLETYTEELENQNDFSIEQFFEQFDYLKPVLISAIENIKTGAVTNVIEKFKDNEQFRSFVYTALSTRLRSEEIDRKISQYLMRYNLRNILTGEMEIDTSLIEKSDVVIEDFDNTDLADIINEFNAMAARDPDNKDEIAKGIDKINTLFKLYLGKCTKPEDIMNDIPSRILQCINQKHLKEEHREKLRRTYEDVFLKKFEPQIDKRIEEISNQNPDLMRKIKNRERLSDEDLELFKEYSYLQRAKDGIFSKEVIDCCVRFDFEVRSSNSEYITDIYSNNTIYRLVEDFGVYLLRENDLDEHFISTYSEMPGFATGAFNPDEKNIRINMSFIAGPLSRTYFQLRIQCCFHEVQHAIQYRAMDNSNEQYDYFIYDMMKDNLLFNNNFYKNNYHNMKIEIDARLAERVKFFQYLHDMGIDDRLIIDLKQARIKYEVQDIKHDIENRLNNQKKADESTIVSSDYLFQQHVREDPSIIKNNPVLQFEFDEETGERKDNIKILQDYYKYCIDNGIQPEQVVAEEFAQHISVPNYYGSEKKGEEQKMCELFLHIMFNESVLSDDQILQEIEELKYVKIGKSEYEAKFSSIIENIVENDIVTRLEFWEQECTIFSDLSKEQILNTLQSLQELANNYPESLRARINDKVEKIRDSFNKGLITVDEPNSSDKEISALESISRQANSKQVDEYDRLFYNMLEGKEGIENDSTDPRR